MGLSVLGLIRIGIGTVILGRNLDRAFSNHYNQSDFFQGSKPLKKVLKNLEKNYFKSPIDP